MSAICDGVTIIKTSVDPCHLVTYQSFIHSYHPSIMASIITTITTTTTTTTTTTITSKRALPIGNDDEILASLKRQRLISQHNDDYVTISDDDEDCAPSIPASKIAVVSTSRDNSNNSVALSKLPSSGIPVDELNSTETAWYTVYAPLQCTSNQKGRLPDLKSFLYRINRYHSRKEQGTFKQLQHHFGGMNDICLLVVNGYLAYVPVISRLYGIVTTNNYSRYPRVNELTEDPSNPAGYRLAKPITLKRATDYRVVVRVTMGSWSSVWLSHTERLMNRLTIEEGRTTHVRLYGDDTDTVHCFGSGMLPYYYV
jgi:hypothetical protein